MAKISVIMPTYNRGYIIGRAIESVISQTYRDFELLIIDDGSIDNTKEVAEGYGDSRIYYEWSEHKGPAFAFNQGLKKAKGDYIAYLGSDESWSSSFLEVMFKELEKRPNVGMVYCGYLLIYQTLQGEIRKEVRKEPYDYQSLLRRNYIDGGSVLHRRECIDSVGGFDEELDCLLDWDLFIRIGRKYKIEFIDQVLLNCYYREGGDHITTRVNPLKSYLYIYSKIRKMGKSIYPLIVEDRDGEYFAYCPDLKGCSTKGMTRNEVLSRIQDKVRSYSGSKGHSQIELVILNIDSNKVKR